jgi:hypothetical protein
VIALEEKRENNGDSHCLDRNKASKAANHRQTSEGLGWPMGHGRATTRRSRIPAEARRSLGASVEQACLEHALKVPTTPAHFEAFLIVQSEPLPLTYLVTALYHNLLNLDGSTHSRGDSIASTHSPSHLILLTMPGGVTVG